MYFAVKRLSVAAALVIMFVVLLANFAYANASPTVTVANVSANDGQLVKLVFTFQNTLNSSVTFDVEGNAHLFGVCRPDGDCARVPEFEFEPTVAPHSTVYRTVTLTSTGFGDGDGESWHFTFAGNYSWESSNDRQGQGTYSSIVTLTDPSPSPLAPTPEPGTVMLLGSGLIGLGGLARRKLRG